MHLPRALILSFILLLALGAAGAASLRALRPETASRRSETIGQTSPAAHYAGWAMEAYPGDSLQRLEGEMRRQIHGGANVVWLGHNNPGEVGYGKREPGLSYAVWAAYRNPQDTEHQAALAMVQAQKRALEAARSLGVRVVLPIGYQIEMGTAWNVAHPQDLRRAADGTIYDASGGPNNSASFYAPAYRRDIDAYYRWIDASFVRPYAGTIFMLNLADEPEGGDYSLWADRAFRARQGYGLFEAGADPARQEEVGRFESDYIADYAAWSARRWLKIDPSLPVTMSFCGGYSRYMHEGPNLESIFRKTPANFVATFDAYPRDGLYDTPLRQGDLIALFTLVRTLGYYSFAYHRALWLWSAANSWGLNEASPDPGRIADAVANAIYLVQLARQTGGDLRGLAVWNYNVRDQGLYGDSHRLSYAPDRMFARVSASFPLLRRLMDSPAGRPNTAILAPDGPTLRIAGAERAMRATDQYRWEALAAPARANVAAVAITRLAGPHLTALRTALVLAREPGDLSPADRRALRRLLLEGGTVVAAEGISRELADGMGAGGTVASDGSGKAAVRRLATAGGTLLAVRGVAVEDLFSDESAGWTRSLWLLVLHRSVPAGGFMVSHGETTLLYSVARSGALMAAGSSAGARGMELTIYGSDGAPLQRIHTPNRGGSTTAFIGRRSYALMSHADENF